MNKIYTGGPAFPIFITTQGVDPKEIKEACKDAVGLTLRDHFAVHTKTEELGSAAAEAITGRKMPIYDDYKDKTEFWIDSIAFWAMANATYKYMQADAMLVVRDQVVRDQ